METMLLLATSIGKTFDTEVMPLELPHVGQERVYVVGLNHNGSVFVSLESEMLRLLIVVPETEIPVPCVRLPILLLKALQSVEERKPFDAADDCVIEMAPVLSRNIGVFAVAVTPVA
jgi:hypothetical protein